MPGLRNRYLISSAPREQLADALLEYRAFIAAHPDDPFAEYLADVSRRVHAALHEEREVIRAIGWNEKVNARVQMTPQQRKTLGSNRRKRLAAKVTG